MLHKALSLTQDLEHKTCHSLKTKLINKFINARLQIYCKKGKWRTKKNTEENEYSKIIAMRN